MRHPFSDLEATVFRRRFVPLLVATLATFAALAFVDTHYHTPATPYGILSLQVAHQPLHVQWILEQWSARVGMNAWVAFGLGFDYLFMPLYGITLALACVRLGERLGDRSSAARTLGVLLGYGALLAALLDAVENAAHFAMLVREPIERWLMVGFVCATGKQALLGACLSFCLVAGIATRFVKKAA